MNTRRRILAGLAATGLLPPSLMAQTRPDPNAAVSPVFACRHAPALGPSGLLTYNPVNDSQTIRYVYKMVRPVILSNGVQKAEDVELQAELELIWTEKDGAALQYDGFRLRIEGISPEGLPVIKDENPFGPKSKIEVMFAIDYPDVEPNEIPYHLEKAERGSFLFSLPLTRDVNSDAVDGVHNLWKLKKKFRVIIRTVESDVRQIRTAPFPYALPAVTKLFPAIKQTLEAKLKNNECEIVDPTQGCFLTTASVNAVGLPDDCAELRCLRQFRDGPLQRQKTGAALVADYYDRAPAIVAQINRRPTARVIWLRTYCFGILPCVVLIKVGLHSLALRHYKKMFARLDKLSTRQL